jgi:uncharacterized protein YkwD
MKPFAYLMAVWLFSLNGAIPSAPKTLCLSAEEQKLYDLIMEYRKQNNLPPIPLSPKLSLVAKTHARDLNQNYTFNADGPCNPHSWSKRGDWSPCCYTSDHKQAECMWNKPQEIAGYRSAGYEIAYYHSSRVLAEPALAGWKVSPGHNPLLVNSGIWQALHWNAVGVAIEGNYGLVWFGEGEDSGAISLCQ